jgi:hypothetical protein
MEINREKEITKILGGFSFKQLQDAMTIMAFIKRKGIAPEEIVAVVEKRIRVNTRKIKRHRFMTMRLFRDSVKYAETMAPLVEPVLYEECPSCAIPMQLNDNPDDGDSQWTCSRCRFGKYVNATASDELRRLQIEARKHQKEKTDG